MTASVTDRTDDLIFVYGTLHPDRSPAEIVTVTRRLELVSEGTIRARRYQFRDYPGILLDADCTVKGHVFRVPDPALWEQLDAYEGYRPARPDASLFLRKRTLVTLTDGTQVAAWVYEYARPLPRGTSATS